MTPVPAEIATLDLFMASSKAILESRGIIRIDACAHQIGFRLLVILEPTLRLRATLRY